MYPSLSLFQTNCVILSESALIRTLKGHTCKERKYEFRGKMGLLFLVFLVLPALALLCLLIAATYTRIVTNASVVIVRTLLKFQGVIRDGDRCVVEPCAGGTQIYVHSPVSSALWTGIEPDSLSHTQASSFQTSWSRTNCLS
jgi:hypothetical protein